MYQQPMTVEYRDGTIEELATDQSDTAAFEMWALRRGVASPRKDLALMQAIPITYIRVVAWSAHQKATGHRIEFDAWEATVDSVTPGDVIETDPTQESIPVG